MNKLSVIGLALLFMAIVSVPIYFMVKLTNEMFTLEADKYECIDNTLYEKVHSNKLMLIPVGKSCVLIDKD